MLGDQSHSPHKRLLINIAIKAIMNYNITMKNKAIEEEWDVLTTFFPKGWEEMAYETRAITRRRKISNPETLLRVLLIHLADGRSLRSTATYAGETNLCHVNDVALLKRLRASGDWLRWLAKSMHGPKSI